MKQSARWSFAGFEIDTAAGILRKEGEPVKIGRQAFRALALLVSRRGEIVGRDELQKEIWGDRVHVDFEHGLNVCIRQVRLALADDVDGSPVVVTVPREGYRLGVPVKPVADTRWPGWLEWGRGWRVAAVAASIVAVTAVLTTSITWTANPASVAPVPNLRAAAVSRTWPTGSSEAYAWYWRGRGYYDRATGRRPAWALPYFETAASLDPNFALAHASLTVSYLDRAATGVARTESLAKARQAAARAVALGPQLAETHVALAELSYRVEGDSNNAEREFLRAVQLDDHSAYARQRYAAFLHDRRRFDEALEQLRLAKDLDPLSVMTNWQMANELYYSGQYEAAMAQANHTLEIDPSHAWSFRTLGQCLEAVGKPDEAIAAYLKAGQVALGHLGRAYALSGRRAEARQLLDALIRQPVDGTGHNGVAIAFILNGLGEPAKAREWLERTQRDGVRLPFSLRIEPQWDAVRAHFKS
jgi:DNA-binding winged helix-turn-helix (wHTH) protein/tetratricopeptide (TPR) repeat protein